MSNPPEDLNARLEELEFLQNLDRELQRQLDLDHVLALTLDWAMRRSAADTGLIARLDGDVLRVMRVAGYAYQYASKLTREPIPTTSGILGRVVTSCAPVYMAYNKTSAELDHIYEQSRSHFAVPLTTDDNLFGVLHLESRHPAHFKVDMRRFIIAVADRASLSIRNAELFTQISRSEQLKSDMIAMVAHDLRNPLNSVINAATLLKRLRDVMPDNVQNIVRTIEYSANQMRSLIEELLTLERLESGAEIEQNAINLGNVVDDAVARVQGDASAKSQQIEITLPETVVIVRGEFAHFRQAVVNLISNAIKYTPMQGHIAIKLEVYSERAFFDVTDNGYGISPERQKHLFQRFYRAHQPGTEHIQGTGLGLSLVKAVIERANGEVWFKSEPGKGSTFGFWLPLVEDENAYKEAEDTTRRAVDASIFAVDRHTQKAAITSLRVEPPPADMSSDRDTRTD
jgi:signal transduction histidine kinase